MADRSIRFCFGGSIREFSPNIEMTEFTVEQGIDIPLNNRDTATINAIVTTRNGKGVGSVTTSFRRILPDLSWFRVCRKPIYSFSSSK